MVESINADNMASSFAAHEDDDDGLLPFTSGDLLKDTMFLPSGIGLSHFSIS